MKRRLLYIIPILFFAISVLFISVLRTAAVKYETPESPSSTREEEIVEGEEVNIEYTLPFPGKVLPDSPLWPLKALRDKVWYMITTNPSRQADLLLLFADKRLGSAKILIDEGNFVKGLSTLSKAEKYLKQAKEKEIALRKKGYDTSEFTEQLALASLKHYEVMQEIYQSAPENYQPAVAENYGYAIQVYESARDALMQQQITPPHNPFSW